MDLPPITDALPGRLTRRGWSVALVAVVCFLAGLQFGARTLNAIVVPALVALVAATLVVQRAEPPTVRRSLPEPGAPGAGGPVELAVSGDRRGVYRVRERVPDGLSASETVFDVPGDEATLRYHLTYDRRGEHSLGPVTVTVTDVLGLASREVEVSAATRNVVVYPPLVTPPSHVLAALGGVVGTERRHGREEFESLREYQRGDALRDVHWKASAKRPDDDLVVTQFEQSTPEEAVVIGVEATGSLPTVDAVATAAASLAVHLLDAGVEVGVALPDDSVGPATGRSQRRAILVGLARFSSATLPDGVEDDLRVTASDGEAVVRVDGETVAFDSEAGDQPAVRA